ncbi:MAG: pyridoxal phosphate-dependent aminotransferase [Salaquimonas sp.]|nr:pyridoxal phosphate-dependent aminotransferase [Salaquimonas sp.]
MRSIYPLRPFVADLPATVPFVGPEAQERARGKPFRARIGANECLFGPSPRAIGAMAEAGREIWKYGDPEGYDLRHAIATHYGVTPAHVVIGPGIDGLLGHTTRLFVEEGVHVVTSDGAYPTFNFHVTGHGGTLHKVKYRDDREDLGALLDRAREVSARLIYLSNPDNPMGTWWKASEIAEMIVELPENCLLVLDEAYSEFGPADAVVPIDADNWQVLHFRTFSKAYGMAGARVGYLIGEKGLIAEYEKVRDHYGMNRTAEIGAVAALADQEWLKRTVKMTAEARERISAIASAPGLTPIPSATNFVTIDCHRDAAYAKSVLEGLLKRGVFVRMPGAEPLSRCIRVSAGWPADLDCFEEALGEVLKELG